VDENPSEGMTGDILDVDSLQLPSFEDVLQQTQGDDPVMPMMPMLSTQKKKETSGIDLLLDVPLRMSVVLGKTVKTIREVLGMGPGSVMELDKMASEPVDIMVNDKLIAHGEVVVVDENFGVRVTDIVTLEQRLNSLR